MRAFEDNPAITCAFTNAALIDARSRPTGNEAWARFLFTPELQTTMAGGDAASVLLQLPVATGATMVFRAELRALAWSVPDVWRHDGWIAWMAALTGTLMPVSEALIRYRIHEGQQLGLPAESGRQRLRRLGLRAWLGNEKNTVCRRYQDIANTYSELAAFADANQLGSRELRDAIREKAEFGVRALADLATPRVLRLLPMLWTANGYRRFTPHGLSSILRNTVL